MTKNKEIINIHKPKPEYKIISEIAERWSPRFFSDEMVSKNDLNILFEASRWAPSGHNQQPWHYYYVKKGSVSYQKLFATLDPYNQSWASTAPVLIVACAIVRNKDEENQFAYYDLGASVFSLVIQAQSLGYSTRQMGLFDRQKVKAEFKVIKDIEPFIIIALGKIGDYQHAPKQIVGYEFDPRPRKSHIFSEL